MEWLGRVEIVHHDRNKCWCSHAGLAIIDDSHERCILRPNTKSMRMMRGWCSEFEPILTCTCSSNRQCIIVVAIYSAVTRWRDGLHAGLMKLAAAGGHEARQNGDREMLPLVMALHGREAMRQWRSGADSVGSFGQLCVDILKGYGVATLAQNKIFLTKQELLLSEITGLPLDAQMQQKRLDVDEHVEGSRQCSCSRPSWLACAARPIQVLQMQHLQGIHTYGGGSDTHWTATSASATRRERWRRDCYLKKSCLFRTGVVHIYWEINPPHHRPLAIRD
jgi:hypothetical protein